MPPALVSEPSPGIEAKLLVEAFLFVNHSRPSDINGPSALSLKDIQAAANMYGYVSSSEEYSFIRAMQSLDGFYLNSEKARLTSTPKIPPK